jgi:hypothetical protein
VKNRPKNVMRSMPKNTAVPSACRIPAPGPVTITSGTTPRIMATAVMRMAPGTAIAARTAMAILPDESAMRS